MSTTTLNRIVVALTAVFISALFIGMVRPFLVSILLAGVFSALAQPLYKRILRLLGGRRNIASLATLLALLVIVVAPMTAVLGVFASQAVRVGLSARQFVESMSASPSAYRDYLATLPFADIFIEYQGAIIQRAGEVAARAGSLLVEKASSITALTISSVFQFFVFLYTMFFFLKDGKGILDRFLDYLPLPEGMERRLLARFTSVTRATLKGVLVTGIVQGSLGGLAFRIAGIDGALFWGIVMTFASIIPAVGPALVWVPASMILAVTGSYVAAAFLFAFCALIVSGVDNLLRPWLVGRDTRMHELMVFFGTLGGLGMFGITGIILGPLVAALFITVWDIYAENLSDLLPDRTRPLQENPSEERDGADPRS
ncbi:MAG TPA: AI-2E family transporter [Deltaproteobacteria bacterium]|nr:AI-2E family transporter [Deltaproteobacteria bacterium]